jgi:hypothetical protein
MLNEQVWRRWSAIAVGFVGVLMVIQPHPGDVNAWTWLVVFSSLAGALRDILGRYVPPAVPSLVASLSSAVTVGVVGCAWAMIDGWQPMPLNGVGFVIGSSLLLATGYQLLMLALRTGAAFSVIGSFRYSSVLWAIGIGYVLWGDVPDLLATRHRRSGGIGPLHPPSRARAPKLTCPAVFPPFPTGVGTQRCRWLKGLRRFPHFPTTPDLLGGSAGSYRETQAW